MSRRKRSNRGFLKLFLVGILVYGATFLAWSRVRTFRASVEQGRVWSFFPPPVGLSTLNPARWSGWKRKEKVAGMIFWPCILLDEKFTQRRYWPARFADPPRPGAAGSVRLARLTQFNPACAPFYREASPAPAPDGLSGFLPHHRVLRTILENRSARIMDRNQNLPRRSA